VVVVVVVGGLVVEGTDGDVPQPASTTEATRVTPTSAALGR
jgi:hypothetical protein